MDTKLQLVLYAYVTKALSNPDIYMAVETEKVTLDLFGITPLSSSLTKLVKSLLVKQVFSLCWLEQTCDSSSVSVVVGRHRQSLWIEHILLSGLLRI